MVVVVCANVGVLLVARNATREAEMAVRSALGASRSRVVAQLFMEALVLAALASAIGLGLTIVGLRIAEGLAAEHLFGSGLPFWWRGGLAPGTLLYVFAFAVLSAVVTGCIPALRVTNRPPGSSLQRFASGDLGLQDSHVQSWAVPALIVVSMPILALLVGQIPHSLTRAIDIPALERPEDFLTGVLRTGERSDTVGGMNRYVNTRIELERRLLATPGVDGVTFASAMPGTLHPRERVEVEGGGVTYATVPSARVAPGFFEVMGASILFGREFSSGDVAPDGHTAAVVVVNESFARRAIGETNALGRRIRVASRQGSPGPWLEVVGVVSDLGMSLEVTDRHEGLYFPLSQATYPVSIAVHLRPERGGTVPLWAIGIEVDPSVDIAQVTTLGEIIDRVRLRERLVILALAIPALLALLLAASAIFTLMSFAVSRRTREIGIRRALGAPPGRIVLGVLSGALKRVGIGVGIGLPSTLILSQGFAAQGSGMIIGAVAAIVMAGLFASVVPTWRSLSVQPTEAIRHLT